MSQPIKFHGGKSYLSKVIHSFAPPSINEDQNNGYTHRLIPYAGGLGELWKWDYEGVAEVINDINVEVTNFWSVLKEDDLFKRFVRVAEATPFSQLEWESSRSPKTDVVERALSFFTKYRQSRQGLAQDYATPTVRLRRGMVENVSAWLTAVEGLPQFHRRLSRIEIRSLHALKFIKTYDHKRAFFYCDPPYLHSTRAARSTYQYEMTVLDHARMLRLLSKIEGKFLLSGYNNRLYERYATKYNWNMRHVIIDNKASSKKVKEDKAECFWSNY